MSGELTVFTFRKPRKCPSCGSKRVATILYGMPSSDVVESPDYNDKFVLGGCCISEASPVWRCLECDTPFYREAARSILPKSSAMNDANLLPPTDIESLRSENAHPRYIPSDTLTLNQVPLPTPWDWDAIQQFALSFDAYKYCAASDAVGELANRARANFVKTGEMPSSISEMRLALFFEQRRWRHYAEEPEAEDREYLCALMIAIRDLLRARDADNVPESCRRCERHGLRFRRRLPPEDFIEGHPSARIWIVGLNPAGESRAQTAAEARAYFDGQPHPYFNDFHKVLPEIFAGLGRPGGVAHTDIVKCASSRFPPPGMSGPAVREVISQCLPYLEFQIRAHHPQVLICNGSAVSDCIRRILPPARESEHLTSYVSMIADHEVHVVLTGFIGRIDDYSKRRLGQEIEGILRQLDDEVSA